MCAHEETFDDFDSDSCICLLCGTVVEKNLSLSHSVSQTSDCQKLEKKIFEDVEHILSKLFIFSQDVSHQCTLRILYWLQRKEKFVKERELFAYGLYDGLNLLEIPCNPTDITRLCSVKQDAILKVEKILGVHSRPCPTSFYVSKICACLDVPFFLERMVRQKILLWEKKHFVKPETLVGSCILHCIKHMAPKQKSLVSHLSIDYIAKNLDISDSSLYRFCKKIKRENKF